MDFKEKREKMFNIGSYVMYGKRGVCKVEDIGEFFKESMGDSRDYYRLSPIFVKGDQVYIPVDNQMYMREVISSEAAIWKKCRKFRRILLRADSRPDWRIIIKK